MITFLYLTLSIKMKDYLITETLHALTAIDEHKNLPTQHIVEYEGVVSMKKKLKTVSEKLKNFVNCSCTVNIEEGVDEERECKEENEVNEN